MARVALIYLPDGAGGRKQGVDDYLASGKTLDDLLSHATNELRTPPREERPEPSCPYRQTAAGIVWDKPTQAGPVPTPLANFAARIVRDVAEDDGAEVSHRFEVEATLNGRRQTFSVPSSQFTGMGWVTEHLGANAILYPGFGVKDHARAAVQLLSGAVPAEQVYAHTGWRELDGEWVYLHAGGAIGRVGRVEGVRTELSGALGGRVLPAPPEGDDLVRAVRAGLTVLSVAPDRLVIPVFAAVYRAALGDTDFSLHLAGSTGEGKSELPALSQQHFGAALDARNLASWESTENAIEGQAFQAKDQVMVLDDFASSGTSYDVQRWHKKADRVLRAKGNASGRQRMRPDTTLRPEKPPRALILSTGEDVPRGQSLRARMLVLELGPGEIDWRRLTGCQRDAAAGLYARSISGFVRWLAHRYEDMRSGFRAEHAALREAASRSEQHRRTAGIVADLALGLRYFSTFAYEAGALTAEQAEELRARGWRALGEAAAAQHQHQAAGEPTLRFRELLSAAIASKQAHVAGLDGSEPKQPEAWGWQAEERMGAEGFPFTICQPKGPCIGWLDGEDLFLQPEASLAAAKKQGRDSGDTLDLSGRTLRKRLDERRLLASKDEKRQVLTVRRTLVGRRQEVLHTLKDFLFTESDQPDHEPEEAEPYASSSLPLWSDPEPPTRPVTDHEPDRELASESDGRVPHGHWSGDGRVPDQQEPLIDTGSSVSGRVGRVSDVEQGKHGSDGAWTGRTREQVRHGEENERLEPCIHGYPNGSGCHVCDSNHPDRLKEGAET